MNEVEAILRQKIEGNVVDSIISYVRSKKQRSDALPYKLFEAKNCEIDVVSPGMDDIGIGLYVK